MNLPLHGSNPHYLYEALRIPMPKEFLDFSVNLNPLGQPKLLTDLLKERDLDFSHYPDPYHTKFKRKLSISEGRNPETILVGNGAAEIIHLIACYLQGKRVAVLQPAFSEYELSCRAFSCIMDHVIPSPRPEWSDFKKAAEKADALFICNPSNPSGTVLEPDLIEKIVRYAQDQDCLVIIDEAFHDFASENCSSKHLLDRYQNLILLRSMTKMFSMAGLRLGYALMTEGLKTKLETYQPHWSVNSLALKAGEVCLDQWEFIEKTRKYITRERTEIFSFLAENEFSFSNSQTNFYLMKDDKVEDQMGLITFLLESGIVPRHTYNFRSLEGRWLRLAVKDVESNEKLREVLRKWREK